MVRTSSFYPPGFFQDFPFSLIFVSVLIARCIIECIPSMRHEHPLPTRLYKDFPFLLIGNSFRNVNCGSKTNTSIQLKWRGIGKLCHLLDTSRLFLKNNLKSKATNFFLEVNEQKAIWLIGCWMGTHCKVLWTKKGQFRRLLILFCQVASSKLQAASLKNCYEAM